MRFFCGLHIPQKKKKNGKQNYWKLSLLCVIKKSIQQIATSNLTYALSELKLNIFHTTPKWHHNSRYTISYYLFTPIITGKIEKCIPPLLPFLLSLLSQKKRIGLFTIPCEESRILDLFFLLSLRVRFLYGRIGGCHIIILCAVLHVLKLMW